MTETMKRIKQELEIQNLSQANFARQLRVTEVTVHRWLTGKRQPSIKYVEQMAAVLGLHVLLWK